jgi:propanol-preferring alcohol dehydrogenase
MTIVRGLKIVGSSVGTEKEMGELLEMAAKGGVRPIVKVFEFEKLDEILGLLARGEVSGRVVVRIPE